MELSVYYFACNDEEGWCLPVTQTYAILLEVDQDGGRARRPGGNGFAGRGGFGANESPEIMVERMLLMGDWDGDDRNSRDEAPEQILHQFEQMDANGDGFADKDELMQMIQRQPSKNRDKGFCHGCWNRIPMVMGKSVWRKRLMPFVSDLSE